MINIQDEAMKIHHQYGTSEMANYKLQLLAEQYAKEYHESEVKKLRLQNVSQQRELLVAFADWVFEQPLHLGGNERKLVDEFLSNQ